MSATKTFSVDAAPSVGRGQTVLAPARPWVMSGPAGFGEYSSAHRVTLTRPAVLGPQETTALRTPAISNAQGSPPRKPTPV